MSTSLLSKLQKEELVFGYIRTNCIYVVPVVLNTLCLSFYDVMTYWHIAGKQREALLSSKIKECIWINSSWCDRYEVDHMIFVGRSPLAADYLHLMLSVDVDEDELEILAFCELFVDGCLIERGLMRFTPEKRTNSLFSWKGRMQFSERRISIWFYPKSLHLCHTIGSQPIMSFVL